MIVAENILKTQCTPPWLTTPKSGDVKSIVEMQMCKAWALIFFVIRVISRHRRTVASLYDFLIRIANPIGIEVDTDKKYQRALVRLKGNFSISAKIMS